MRVILHADDLGISERVNEAIFALMDDGKITSASILANGPATAEAARQSQRFPQCSFGLHLNLTEFEPLRPSPAFGKTMSSLWIHRWTARAVLDEWNAQLRRLRQYGVPVSHVDSHHHVHTRLTLLPCLREFCRTMGIERVRLRHTFGASSLSRCRIDNRLYNTMLRRKAICTDEFGPITAFPWQRATSPHATAELMLHPGHDGYEAESEAIRHCATPDFLRLHQPITYRELT